MDNTSISTVRVDLGARSYNLEIGAGNLPNAGAFLAGLGDLSHAVILTDENVEPLYASAVAEELAERGVMVDLIVVEPGEATKSIESCAALWEKMLEVGCDRRTVMIAVGGGVVGDLAGFVAATFARGIRFFQIPTSLLAQVDSSVGGKVGVNLPAAKNMVGAFLQPIGVLIDTKTLDTLDLRQYRAGLGEVVKYGVIMDEPFFASLEANVDRLNARDHDYLREVVSRCCRLKGDVVEKDEREESGLRAILNYGHTYAHAFETLAGYGEILHGEAVAIGMLCASRLAERLGRIDSVATQRQFALLEALGLPTETPSLDVDAILESMMRDKKVQHGKLKFVLPTKIGHCELVGDVDPELVRESLKTPE